MALRDGFGDERYEKAEFQQKVRDCYEKLYDSSYWQKIDANRSEKELTDVLKEYVEKTITAAAKQNLNVLW